MAITSSINVDEIAGTVELFVYEGGVTLLDHVVYTNSTLQVTMASHGQVTHVGVTDFLKLLQLYIVFNNAIISSIFGPSPFLFTPFSNIDNQLVNDGINQLTFTFQFTPTDPLPICQFIGTYPNGSFIVQKRGSLATLSYAQWLYFLYQATNFKLFVLNAYHM